MLGSGVEILKYVTVGAIGLWAVALVLIGLVKAVTAVLPHHHPPGVAQDSRRTK